MAAAFALETPSRDGWVDLTWLARSHADALGFWAALERRSRALDIPAAKSAPDVGFDLYADAIARHLGAGRAALRWYERAALSGVGQWRSLSFDDLHARCGHRAAWWAARGVEPGATVCVVLPFGPDCVVSLLSALRLGARVSLLEPLGPRYLEPRLAALAPQHIATEPFYLPRLGAFAALALPPDEIVPSGPSYSHTYLPGEPCLAAYSPLRDDPITPVDVTADSAYVGALADGLIAFALRPGDHLTAPGFHTVQHQPAMLLAALVTGAAFVHIEEADVVREPSLVHAVPARSAGVTATVRDALMSAGASDRPAWQHWFRNPEEPTDWEAWRAFVQALDLGDVPMSNVVVEAASGGSLLWSPRRPGTVQLRYLCDVVPAPGRAWTLLDFTRSGQPAVADVGVYAPAVAATAGDGDGAADGDGDGDGDGAGDGGGAGDGASAELTPLAPQHMVLARRGNEYLYGGAIEPRRAGRVYPAGEVLAAIEDVSFVDGATVVAVSAGGTVVAHRFVLVVFTGAETAAHHDARRAARVAELDRRIATALGAEFTPDSTVTFPLHARRANGDPAGDVDHDWCRAQFLSGLLFRKARTPVFLQLEALRATAREAAAAPAQPGGGG